MKTIECELNNVEELKKEKNINFYKNSEGKLGIEIYSYDRDLSNYPECTKKLFNKIVKLKDDILDHFNKETFILSIDSYSIDGLYETNSLLIDENSVLTSIY